MPEGGFVLTRNTDYIGGRVPGVLGEMKPSQTLRQPLLETRIIAAAPARWRIWAANKKRKFTERHKVHR